MRGSLMVGQSASHSFTIKLFKFNNQIEVRRGQKYVLVLHLVEISDEIGHPNKCMEFIFEETEFVTVNCHQNQVNTLFLYL